MSFLLNNPVLQRELLTNLRLPRAFVLMSIYQLCLSAIILLAYPRGRDIAFTGADGNAQRLVDYFFIGQFVIASLMTPSFAAGAIAGEKERKTYEMLLASPIRPSSIVFGKLAAALTHLLILIVGSIPIVMLCLPLGGVALQDLTAAYIALLASILVFGSISIGCSSYFRRTSSSLVVSYALILPIVVAGCIGWLSLAGDGYTRFLMATFATPFVSVIVSLIILFQASHRLLYPPDVGSGGNDVIDIENEQANAIGLVIQRDRFPDRLFAPPRRTTLLADTANPIYDKEIHAELFSQGTLMLRLVITASMILAFPMMGVFLFGLPNLAHWYIGYVLIFNVLVAPVFLAGSISNERERQTLDLLLTTTLSPATILFGKFAAGFRVSFVLTMFLMWPVLLGAVLNIELASRNWPALIVYVATVLVCCLLHSLLAMLCSVLFKRTSSAMMMSYIILIALYMAPAALEFVLSSFSFNAESDDAPWMKWIGVTSPFMVLDQVPFASVTTYRGPSSPREGSWEVVIAYFGLQAIMLATITVAIFLIFRIRRQVTIA